MWVEDEKIRKLIEEIRTNPTREYVEERGRAIALTFIIEELLQECERLNYECMGEDL